LGYFLLKQLLHFHLNRRIRNVVCFRYFKVSKLVGYNFLAFNFIFVINIWATFWASFWKIGQFSPKTSGRPGKYKMNIDGLASVFLQRKVFHVIMNKSITLMIIVYNINLKVVWVKSLWSCVLKKGPLHMLAGLKGCIENS
jgi:hypothetical protein